jgi:hypothetical protein
MRESKSGCMRQVPSFADCGRALAIETGISYARTVSVTGSSRRDHAVQLALDGVVAGDECDRRQPPVTVLVIPSPGAAPPPG